MNFETFQYYAGEGLDTPQLGDEDASEPLPLTGMLEERPDSMEVGKSWVNEQLDEGLRFAQNQRSEEPPPPTPLPQRSFNTEPPGGFKRGSRTPLEAPLDPGPKHQVKGAGPGVVEHTYTGEGTTTKTTPPPHNPNDINEEAPPRVEMPVAPQPLELPEEDQLNPRAADAAFQSKQRQQKLSEPLDPQDGEIASTFAVDDPYGQKASVAAKFTEMQTYSHLTNDFMHALAEKDRLERERRIAEINMMQRAAADLAEDNKRLLSLEGHFEVDRDTLSDYNV